MTRKTRKTRGAKQRPIFNESHYIATDQRIRQAMSLAGQAGLRPMARHLTLLLAAADGPGGAWPSVAKLAETLGCSRQWVHILLNEVEATGIYRRHGAPGKTNIYQAGFGEGLRLVKRGKWQRTYQRALRARGLIPPAAGKAARRGETASVGETLAGDGFKLFQEATQHLRRAQGGN